MTEIIQEMPDHRHGTCWVNRDWGWCYVNIPKNGSNTFKEILKYRGFSEGNFNDESLENFKSFTVLRDPVERYISAYLEILDRYLEKHARLPDRYPLPCAFISDPTLSMLNRFDEFLQISEFALFDEHIQQQSWFLRQADGQHFQFDAVFNLETLNRDWHQFLARWKLSLPSELPRRYTSRRSDEQRTLRRQIYNSPSLLSRIRNLYLADIKLHTDHSLLLRT